MVHLISYLKARLAERSTWAAMGLGIGGAAALPAPWSYLAAAFGIIGALVPSSSATGS